MQLTKGQKDALVHKVMDIIAEKKEKKKEELKKNYKPSKEAAALFNKAKKIIEARDAYVKAVKAAGLNFCSYDVETPYDYCSDSQKFSICIRHSGTETIDSIYESIMIQELNKINDTKFPKPNDIYDELELLNLDKSFDLSSFLAKYENL